MGRRRESFRGGSELLACGGREYPPNVACVPGDLRGRVWHPDRSNQLPELHCDQGRRHRIVHVTPVAMSPDLCSPDD